MIQRKKIKINVNGNPYSVDVDFDETLLDVLRYKLKLKGSKKGCSVGECGACTVIIDGVSVDSCLYLAIWADKKSITTIEGIENHSRGKKIQDYYVKNGAVQCGFCSPGFIVQTYNILENKKIYKRKEIRENLTGNLCRCTGYEAIINAVEEIIDDEYSENIIKEEDGCVCKSNKQ